MFRVMYGVRVPRLFFTSALLTAFVLMAGCAAKTARNESQHFGSERNRIAALAEVPRPIPRARRLGRGLPPEPDAAPAAEPMDDGARYAEVYGVAPPPRYSDDMGTGQSSQTWLPPATAAVRRAETVLADARIRSERRVVVTFGDTLYNLAWRYKTTVAALLSVNRLDNTNIQIGQELILPPVRR